LLLNGVLNPHTIAAFLVEYLGVRPLYVSGEPGKFAPLISWPGAWKPGDIQVVERVDQVCGPVMHLARDLEWNLEAPIEASLYAGSGATDLHRVERDILVLQIAGQSRFRVWDKTESEQPDNDGADTLLEDGDAIYLPRGCRQMSAATPTPGLRLAFTIGNPTGVDLLSWLFDRLKRHEYFAADLPRFAPPAAQADYLTGMRRVLMRACRTPGLLDLHSTYLSGAAEARPACGIPWSPGLPAHYLLAMAAPRPLRLRRGGDDFFACRFSGKEYRFPLEAAQFFHFLQDEAPVAISAFFETFEPEFDREDLDGFLSLLSREGIVTVVATS
jgi:hypothetical protein